MRAEGDSIFGGRNFGTRREMSGFYRPSCLMARPDSFIAMTHFARQLVTDPDLGQCMGIAGRERAAQCYSIHGWADTIAEVLVGAASH